MVVTNLALTVALVSNVFQSITILSLSFIINNLRRCMSIKAN